MKKPMLGIAVFLLTIGVIAFHPSINARTINAGDGLTYTNRPVVDVVFVLDTTGSMSGLIQTAKEKIWSIATTMASAQPAPEIRIGLVAYRDRGDAYVTKTVDLSSDLDSVYAALMDFQADGGGDMPESVNAALERAVNDMSWSDSSQAYQVIFLVGDAPPHTDYQDEAQYPEILAAAHERGIIVNAIQCGDLQPTVAAWTDIAHRGNGSFFQVEQAGGAVAYSTPYDAELASLSARLDATRVYYGSDEERDAMAEKTAAADKLSAHASDEAKARRGVFNLSESGRTNLLGKKELIDDVASGAIELDELREEELPAAIMAMAPAEQQAYVQELSDERAAVTERMRALAESRDEYIKERLDEDGGAAESLDQKLYDTIARQAREEGFEYADGPAY